MRDRVNSIRLIEDNTRWGAVMNAVMNHGGLWKRKIFVPGQEAVN